MYAEQYDRFREIFVSLGRILTNLKPAGEIHDDELRDVHRLLLDDIRAARTALQLGCPKAQALAFYEKGLAKKR